MRVDTTNDPFGFSKYFGIGSDKVFDNILKISQEQAKNLGYPPYNIRKEGDNKYVIEMAVAGFGEQDITIELDNNVLRIKGSVESSTEDSKYVYKGISTKAFERTFAVDDSIVVNNAEMINGLLRVWFDRIVQSNTVKTIPVNGKKADK
jgi:molecular chaperone IbpA